MSLMLKLVLLFFTVLASLIWVILPPNEPQSFQTAPRRRLRSLETNSNSSAVVEEQVDAVALSADGTLLNTMIQVALPFVNSGIKQFTPDPLDLNIAG